MAKLNNGIDGSPIPPIIFGTSGLGNLFVTMDEATKCDIVRECILHTSGAVVFDTAGKYGAGLALECLGKSLAILGVKQEDIIISNKLGWYRTKLTTAEPTFEPGVWKDLTHDAVQKISFGGILECFVQGNELLNGYKPQWVSVHDPDEYLASAADSVDEVSRYNDILEAYRALQMLKDKGEVQAIGVGAMDWRTIQRIAGDVELDWVMFANSLTIYEHPETLINFIRELNNKGVYVINSAVFHAGFLTGGDYFNYKKITPDSHQAVFQWRQDFFSICNSFGVRPADACAQFALAVPGIGSIALNTTSPQRVKENIDIVRVYIPETFWEALYDAGLISKIYRLHNELFTKV